MTNELTQMHDTNVFRPIEVESLTYDKKKEALSLLMFLKEKRDSLIKVRMCADGCKQKDGTWAKQDTTSLTVATESVFITAVIGVHEGRDVACFNIPGAFLHTDVDEDITIVFKCRLAELMVQVAPNLYRKYITVNRKGTAILYVKMQKALYGLLRSALLFYNKLVADLESNGFVLNPYDSCVANKIVNGKQMTVCWHVDDLKVSHCDPAQVTIFPHLRHSTSLAFHSAAVTRPRRNRRYESAGSWVLILPGVQIIVCVLDTFVSSPTLAKRLTRRSNARCRNSASLDARYASST